MVSLFTTFAATSCTEQSFFGLKTWYHYIGMHLDATSHTCEVNSFQVLGGKSGLLLILLAVVDDLLIIAGLVTVIYVIYAGIKYVISQGSPDDTAKARSTLINALIGLTIALIAIASVSFIGNSIGGSAATNVANSGSLNVSTLPSTAASQNTLKSILTIVMAVVGGLSLLFITIGGFRYVISQGDAQAVGKAKNTILYALVGLTIAVVGQVIVSFVIGKVT